MGRVLMDLLFFLLGTATGIVCMCLMQTGKEADSRMENMNDWRND